MSRTTRSSSQQLRQLRQTTLNFAKGSSASKQADADEHGEASTEKGANGNGGYLKRPSPPRDSEAAGGTGDGSDDSERIAKRLKMSQSHSTTQPEETVSQPIDEAQIDTLKPAAYQDSRPQVPELDLVALTPAKNRKKGKEREQLRYTSVPPPESPAPAAPEIMTTSATLPDLVSSRSSPSQSEHGHHSDAQDQMRTPRPLHISPPLNSHISSRSGKHKSLTPVSDSEPERESISRYISFSPLTPLPQASASRPPRPTHAPRSILPTQPVSSRMAQGSAFRAPHNRSQSSSRTVATYQDAVVAVKLEDGSKSRLKARSYPADDGDDGYDSSVSTASRSGRSKTPSRIPRPLFSTALTAQADESGHSVLAPKPATGIAARMKSRGAGTEKVLAFQNQNALDMITGGTLSGSDNKRKTQDDEAGNGRARGRSKSVAGRERSDSVDDRGRGRSQSIVSASRGRSKTPAPMSSQRELAPATNGRGRAKTSVATSRAPAPSDQQDERRGIPTPAANERDQTPSTGTSVQKSMRAKTPTAEPHAQLTLQPQAAIASLAELVSAVTIPLEKEPQTNGRSRHVDTQQTTQTKAVKMAQKDLEVSDMDVEGDTLVEAEADEGLVRNDAMKDIDEERPKEPIQDMLEENVNQMISGKLMPEEKVTELEERMDLDVVPPVPSSPTQHSILPPKPVTPSLKPLQPDVAEKPQESNHSELEGLASDLSDLPSNPSPMPASADINVDAGLAESEDPRFDFGNTSSDLSSLIPSTDGPELSVPTEEEESRARKRKQPTSPISPTEYRVPLRDDSHDNGAGTSPEMEENNGDEARGRGRLSRSASERGRGQGQIASTVEPRMTRARSSSIAAGVGAPGPSFSRPTASSAAKTPSQVVANSTQKLPLQSKSRSRPASPDAPVRSKSRPPASSSNAISSKHKTPDAGPRSRSKSRPPISISNSLAPVTMSKSRSVAIAKERTQEKQGTLKSYFGARPQPAPSSDPTSNTSEPGTSAGGSAGALNTLSLALERLNVPTPSRPNSRLGVSRADDSDEDRMDVDDEKTADVELGLRRSASSASDSTMGTDIGKGKTKQTTLMPPPPVPRGRQPNASSASTSSSMSSITTSGARSTPSTSSSTSQLPQSHRPGGFTTGTSGRPVPARGIFGIAALPPSMTPAKGASSRPGGSSSSRFQAPNGPTGTNGLPRTGTLGATRGAGGISRIGVLPRNSGAADKGRVVHRASKASSLPMVEGSPAKGYSSARTDEDVEMADGSENEPSAGDKLNAGVDDKNPFTVAGPSSSRPSTPSQNASSTPIQAPATLTDTPTASIGSDDPTGSSTKPVSSSWKNQSRRASQALHLLSESLSTLPQTPPRNRKSSGTGGKGKGRPTDDDSEPNVAGDGGVKGGEALGKRVSTRRAAAVAAAAAISPPSAAGSDKGKGKALASDNDVEGEGLSDGDNGAGEDGDTRDTSYLSRSNGTHSHTKAKASDSSASKSGKSKGSVHKRKTLKILRHCNVFVDVRTDLGDDAGGLFVEMLSGLGARILGRVGQSCTHIVYKNGQTSTLTRYRLLDNPKPHVVGIAWVVECVEQRVRVDEKDFLVDIELASIAGSSTGKRRRSMLPKGLLDSPKKASPTANGSGVSEGGGGRNGGQPIVVSSPSSDGAAAAKTANNSFDQLPPLERARARRQSMLFSNR